MQLVHVTIASLNRSSLFPSLALRRRALHCIARVAGSAVVLFCIVDDHLHMVLLVPDGLAATVARNIAFALSAFVPVDIASPYIKPVTGRAHMQWLLRYLLTQARHHGIDLPADRFEGSCFWDLVGARVIPGFQLRTLLAQALPRCTDDDILGVIELPAERVAVANLSQVRDIGATALVAACQRATASVQPTGRARPDVRARAAAIRLGHAAGLSNADLARALGVVPRVARARGRVTVSDDICWAALRQLRLHMAVAELVAPQATGPKLSVHQAAW